jgi:hypothetical protein
MELYKQNVKQLKEFYASDFHSYIQDENPDIIPGIINSLCPDSDRYDKSLYIELGEKFNLPQRKCYLVEEIKGKEIRLSSDVICGRKQLMKHNPNNWINDYESIRSQLDLHFIWPKHKLPTINTYRYLWYRDRIDYLLFDLKSFFCGEDTPMKKAYYNGDTKLWLNQFHNNFPFFIEKMKFNAFVNENYEVLDISKKQKKRINELIPIKRVKESIPTYLDNLLELSRQGNFISKP